MNKLPTETVHEICSLLERKDISQLRLVSKAFSHIAAEYLCSNLFLYMTSDYFQKLVDLSGKPHIARGVRSIEYAPTTLADPKLSEDGYEALEGTQACSEHGGLPGNYKQYEAFFNDQDNILATDRDYVSFLEALPKFPRLKKITLHHDPHSLQLLHNFDPDPTRPVPPPFLRYTPIVSGAGVQTLDMLLRVLSDAQTKLSGLTIRDLDWCFFDIEDAELETLFDPVADLKEFDAGFVNGYPLDGMTPDETVDECRRIINSGAIRKCLPTLTKLETLTLSFGYNAGKLDFSLIFSIRQLLSAPFSQIVPAGHTWSCLKVLKLNNVNCTRHELMGFLRRHKKTLRGLCLRDVHLRNTSWIPFLTHIRNELYITDACVCGCIYGSYERGEGRRGEQQWKLTANDGPAGLINYFILEGGEEFPDLDICPLVYDMPWAPV